MSASYRAKRNRILSQAQGRGKGWAKRALRQLDDDYGARPLVQSGKAAGIALESGAVVCRKAPFRNQEQADARLEEIASAVFDQRERAPVRSYHCLTCGKWHLTSWSSLERRGPSV